MKTSFAWLLDSPARAILMSALLALSGCYTLTSTESLFLQILLDGPHREQFVRVPTGGPVMVVDPSPGSIARAALGDGLLTTKMVSFFPSIALSDTVNIQRRLSSSMEAVVRLHPGKYTYVGDSRFGGHFASPHEKSIRQRKYATRRRWRDEEVMAEVGLVLLKPDVNDSSFKVAAFWRTDTGVNYVPIDSPIEIDPEGEVTVSDETFEQELVYNGRSDGVYRFLYREYDDDRMRPLFSQELSFDLSLPDTVGYKGARLVILEASNTAIVYQVVEGF